MHALNNVYLPWMSEVVSDLPDKEGEYAEFYARNEQDMALVHSRFFAFWEYRQKIKTVSVTLKPTENTHKPIINDKSQKLAQNHLS